jgi:long-subunit fatty acid transport protein
VGLMWTPGEKTSVGLSIAKTEILDSETRSDVYFKPTYSNDSLHVIQKDSGDREYPLSFNLGIAHFPSASTLYSFDVSYYGAADDDFYGKREPVWNAAVGTEHYFNSSWAMRAGLFTNFTSAESLEEGKTKDTNEHVDLYGGSLSISYFSRGASLTLGGDYSQGSGDAQVVSGSTELQDLDMQVWSIFLASSYNF